MELLTKLRNYINIKKYLWWLQNTLHTTYLHVWRPVDRLRRALGFRSVRRTRRFRGPIVVGVVLARERGVGCAGGVRRRGVGHLQVGGGREHTRRVHRHHLLLQHDLC